MTAEPAAGDQAETVAFLSSGAAYGDPALRVERIETHGALVFLTHERAYKLKRAVRYPYMDFSTIARRRDACAHELAINRHTAPDLYLEIRAIVRAADGLRLVPEEESEGAVDWVVVMRRFAQDDLFEQMRRRGVLTEALVRSLADEVAAFHAKSDRTRDHGGAKGIADVIAVDFKVLGSDAGAVFDAIEKEKLARLSWAALDQVSTMLDRRRDQGFVRRCHGDLHLNNVCLFDGRPTLFDAIEFNESFACIDVFYDLAFLLMDLDRHDLRTLANVALNRYLERTRHYDGLSALPLFLSCRAAIRAHVGATRATLMRDDKVDNLLADARALLDRAVDYLQTPPPRLVVIAGSSGSGKTTVARGLAPLVGAAPGAVIVRSDVVRKELQDVDETARLPSSGYTPEVTAKVYEVLMQRAHAVLAEGHSVILDAVFGDPREQAQAQEIAARASVAFNGFWLEASDEVLEQRVASRTGDASDATVDVVRAQRAHLQRPANWTVIQAGRPAADVVAEIAARLS